MYSVIKSWDPWVRQQLFWIFGSENRYILLLLFWDIVHWHIQISQPNPVILWFDNRIQMTITLEFISYLHKTTYSYYNVLVGRAVQTWTWTPRSLSHSRTWLIIGSHFPQSFSSWTWVNVAHYFCKSSLILSSLFSSQKSLNFHYF